jgi:hypothetical protein
VVSCSGYNEAKADLFVGKLSGHPKLAEGLEALLKLATGGRGLDGLDKDRPWGAVIRLDADRFSEGERRLNRLLSGYLFVPVRDLGALLEALRPFVGEVEETGDGGLELTKGRVPAGVRRVGGWAFVGPHNSGPGAPSSLLPADSTDEPAQILRGLNEQYAVEPAFAVFPTSPGETCGGSTGPGQRWCCPTLGRAFAKWRVKGTSWFKRP